MSLQGMSMLQYAFRIPCVLVELQAGVGKMKLCPGYFHIILLERIDGSNWIVADPEGNVEALDLRTEQVIPLLRGHTFPDAGRPFLGFVHLTDVMLAGLRAQSKALHLIVKAQAPLGVVGASGSSSPDSQWLFSDPARGCFNQPVPVDVLADPAKV